MSDIEGFSLGDFDLGAALGIEPEGDPTPAPKKERGGRTRSGRLTNTRMSKRPPDRKMQSERALEDAVQRWAFREGDCYHCFTFGDVDLATFPKFIIRQQYVPFMLVNGWVISGEDLLDMQNWVRRGLVGRIDLYVGEIFEKRSREAYDAAIKLVKLCGGRLVARRNHMKLIAIHGERFSALIESSANMNTNPQSENVVVTIDRRLVTDCINSLADIRPWNRTVYGAPAFRIEAGGG